MKLFNRSKGQEKRTLDFNSVFGSSKPNTVTGLGITPQNSLELTAIWSAVDQISNSVAKLPIYVYRRNKANNTEISDHIISSLLRKPNPFINKFDFFKTMVANLLLNGNSYAWIDRGSRNNINSLWILEPSSVGVNLDPSGKKLTYSISINSKSYQVPHTDIIHLKRLSLDGYKGINPIETSKESIGIAKASNQWLGSYYGNGTSVGDVLEVPAQLDKKAKDAIRSAWQNANSGLDNAKKIAVLDAGMIYKPMTNNKIVDMDFINTQKFYSVEEVARIFNMPSTMLGDLSKATFSNVENLNLLYYKNCISPILTGIENELDDKLLINDNNTFTNFDMSEELRGDTQARVNYYKELQAMGAISPNEVRAKEGFEPIKDVAMDQYFMSLNYAPVNSIKEYQLNKNGGGGGVDAEGTKKSAI
ncbi:phage portal protein [Clostridium gasigenes]|uniref:phage portal protein n=1 Tax=Clostridium gasigenes TaxID=94869 RepID=UPI001623DF55|nr:phage portal protein [Clostridium gasigenes]MBB6622167.1 phage portal protein [Clostridium gasigenes]